MDADALLEGLTEAQAAAVTSDGAPLVILAGAGSGKTRVLTRRIAWRSATGSADPRHVLALTFSRRAARELRNRLGELGLRDDITAGTFHAVAQSRLRQHWADSGQRPRELLTRKAGFLRDRLPDVRLPPEAKWFDLAAEIEWAKARAISPEDYEVAALRSGRTGLLPIPTVASAYVRYEIEKERRGVLDFDDLLLEFTRLTLDDPEFAARQRSWFRHVFVDEFQDVNPLQARFIDALRGTGDDLCVVGDPNQAIYGWNGADPSFLARFAADPVVETIRLDTNFRSTEAILTVAQAILEGGSLEGRIEVHRPGGTTPTLRGYDTDDEEALAVVRGLRAAHAQKVPWSQMAVLARTNAQLVQIEERLRADGVPCRNVSGSLLKDPDVSFAVDRMRRAGGRLDRHLPDVTAEVQDIVAADRRSQARAEALRELVRLGRELLAMDPDATVDRFDAWLPTVLSEGSVGVGGDAVELVSFHAAKGLEWHTVFVIGLEEGLVPISRASDPQEIDEERRLLYVAVTRAERSLRCTWSRSRTFGERRVPRRPSPWIDDIQVGLSVLSSDDCPVGDLRDRVAAERKRLAAMPPREDVQSKVVVGVNADPAVLHALKEWRSSKARAVGVPAFVLFHDTTLAAVAEACPGDREALLGLPGIGPVKAARYGDDLLGVVAEATHSLAS
jgi:DNA helicase-2/ATP-dependent DNA helicase PcrA